METKNLGFGKIAVLAVNLDPQTGQHVFQESSVYPLDLHHKSRPGAGDPGRQEESED